MTTTLDVDSVIERLLSVRGQPNNRTVQLAEGEIRALCAAARCVEPFIFRNTSFIRALRASPVGNARALTIRNRDLDLRMRRASSAVTGFDGFERMVEFYRNVSWCAMRRGGVAGGARWGDVDAPMMWFVWITCARLGGRSGWAHSYG